MFPPCISAVPGALDRYLVTMRPVRSTRRRSIHAVLRNWFSGRQSNVFEARRTKEESQPPVRAKVGATWVPCKSESQIMKAELVQAASEVITSPQILVNMVSRRVRQLTLGHRPLV